MNIEELGLNLQACMQCRAHEPLEKMSVRDFMTGQTVEAQLCQKCRDWMAAV